MVRNTTPINKKRAAVRHSLNSKNSAVKEKVDSLLNSGSKIYKDLLDGNLHKIERRKKTAKMISILEKKLMRLDIDTSLHHLNQTQITKIIGKEFCNLAKIFIESNLKSATAQEIELNKTILELYDNLYSETSKSIYFQKIKVACENIKSTELIKKQLNIIKHLEIELIKIYKNYIPSKKTDMISNSVTPAISYTEILKMTLAEVLKKRS